MTATPLPAGSLRATSLNAARRNRELTTPRNEPVDVLVIGAGTTGAATALDAASRGLSVTLVESGDLASGASGALGDTAGITEVVNDATGTGQGASSSTVRVARRDEHAPAPIGETRPWRLSPMGAARMRTNLTGASTHPLRTVSRVLPLGTERGRSTELSWTTALHGRDAVLRSARVSSEMMPPSRRLSRAGTLALAPGLSTDIRGGLVWFTARPVDEARFALALARTAAGFGARVLSHTQVRAARCDGVSMVDTLDGREWEVPARAVVNAAGAWGHQVDPSAETPVLRRHGLLLDADAVGVAETGLLVPVPDSERFVSVFPLMDGNAWVQPCEYPAAAEPPLQHTVDAVLTALGTVLAQQPSPMDVLGASMSAVTGFSASGKQQRPNVSLSDSGVVAVFGGNPLSARDRAAEAVDTAIRKRGLAAGPSRTGSVPLVGSAPSAQLAETGASPRIVAKYGAEAARLAALTELDPDLAEPVAPGVPVIAAEVVWAVRHEGALHTEDVLRRRVGAGLSPAQRQRAHSAVDALVQQALEGVRQAE